MRLSIENIIIASIVSVRGQELGSEEGSTVGCEEIGCPVTHNTANCTVADRSSNFIGVTRIPTENENLKELSWTKGFYQDQPGERLESHFFLGTPPSLDLNDTGTCAIFFHGIAPSLKFDGPDTNNGTTGTCADALGASCVDTLLKRARTVFQRAIDNGSSDSDLCSAVQEDLEANMLDECRFVSEAPWTDLTSTALSGSDSLQPLSRPKNNTRDTDCWPVLPKENQLIPVTDHVVEGSFDSNSASEARRAITPILTIFYPSSNDSIVEETEASLTCIKVTEYGPGARSGGGSGSGGVDGAGDNNDDDDDESSAMALFTPSAALAAIGGLLAMFFIAS